MHDGMQKKAIFNFLLREIENFGYERWLPEHKEKWDMNWCLLLTFGPGKCHPALLHHLFSTRQCAEMEGRETGRDNMKKFSKLIDRLKELWFFFVSVALDLRT